MQGSCGGGVSGVNVHVVERREKMRRSLKVLLPCVLKAQPEGDLQRDAV